MASNDRIGRLARQLGERLQDASHAPEEIQRSVNSVMRGAFDRMELVSREDFDILMDVLQRTRTRVEALEKQVAALEAALDDEVSASVSKEPAADSAAQSPNSDTKKDSGAKKTASDAASGESAGKSTGRAKSSGTKKQP
nr:accessory factor UbiK family protein [uncultured Halomonas sp.]